MKRYSTAELTEMLNEMAVKELATGTQRWECTTVAETGSSMFRMQLKQNLTNGKVYRERIKDFVAKANEPDTIDEHKKIYKKAEELLEKLCSDDELATLEYQKKLYKKEKNIYNSRSYLEFPLDKKINSLYDDFAAVFLFYDDVATLGNNLAALVESYENDTTALQRFAKLHLSKKADREAFLALTTTGAQVAWVKEKFGENKVDVFEALPSVQDKIDFVSENVEFTHCMLGGADSPSWGIGVYGTMEPKFTKFDENQCALLPEFSDFGKVTLADTLKIRHNDLLQVMQSKIDIDKEGLETVDEKWIGEDMYQIKKLPSPVKSNRQTYQYLIRYVCPSTGRVYHNNIVEDQLQQSRFFKHGDPTTYIYAWWHANNGGIDPTTIKSVTRC